MSKIRVTQQQRDNLLDALNVMWPSVPPDNVAPNLYTFIEGGYEKDIDCGTVACFGGWCSVWPNYKKQGAFLSTGGIPRYQGAAGRDFGTGVARLLFGDMVFNIRGDHCVDIGFKGTDHDLITKRLQWLLDNSVVRK